MKKKTRLFIFSIDSATWDLILSWVKEEKLPGFGKIIKGGNYATFQSTIPFISPCAWTTITTGASPSDHGIYDFYKLTPEGEIDVNSSLDVEYPYVWEILSKLGKRVAVYNIPLTYPPQKVNGIMIADFTSPDLESDFVYPKEAKKKLLKICEDYILTPRARVIRGNESSYQAFFEDLVLWTKNGFKVIDWFLKEDDFDLIFTNIMAVDQVQHFYWDFYEKKKGKFKDAIFKIYKLIDKYLEEILPKYSNKYQFIILSDHGAGDLKGEVFLNYWLYKKDLLKFKNKPLTYLKLILNQLGFTPNTVTKIASFLGLNKNFGTKSFQDRIKALNILNNYLLLSMRDVDFDKSKAYSFGEYNGIYLNKNLSKKERENLVKEIKLLLKKDFKNLLSQVYITEELYGPKKHDKFPDLIPIFEDGAFLGINMYSFYGKEIVTRESVYQKTGDHRREGIFALYPKVFPQNKLPDVDALDITPTILDFFGIEKGSYMKGESIFKKFDAEYKKKHPSKLNEIDDLEI